jgi:hypothetical protein
MFRCVFIGRPPLGAAGVVERWAPGAVSAILAAPTTADAGAGPPPADSVVIRPLMGPAHPAGVPKASLPPGPPRAAAVIVVPAFAVGRTQLLLHLIARLKERRGPDLPVFLNSPTAMDDRIITIGTSTG